MSSAVNPATSALANLAVSCPSQPWLDDYDIHFEPRTMDDILKLDDGLEDEEAFMPVNAVSRVNDSLYRSYISPWVRAGISEISAEAIRQLMD